jgi:hypothetical protein
LWQLSLSWHEHGRPVPVLSWSPTKWRKAEAIRDNIMRGAGTGEPWFMDDPREMAGELGFSPHAVHWRKPLRVDEVARMAPTPEVKAREGRG